MNDAAPPIPVANPIEHAKKEVAAQANAWIVEHPQARVRIVFHQPITAADPETGEILIELRGDIVEKGGPPLGEAPVLKKLYSTLGVVERKIATPAEVLGR